MKKRPESAMNVPLESESQKRIADLVAALPEDTPSLAWRSGLNEAILAEAARHQRRRRFAWTWQPALGLGAACVLALALLVHPSSNVTTHTATPRTAKSTVETNLVALHREASRLTDVSGPGLAAFDAEEKTRTLDGVDWNEADLDGL